MSRTALHHIRYDNNRQKLTPQSPRQTININMNFIHCRDLWIYFLNLYFCEWVENAGHVSILSDPPHLHYSYFIQHSISKLITFFGFKKYPHKCNNIWSIANLRLQYFLSQIFGRKRIFCQLFDPLVLVTKAGGHNSWWERIDCFTETTDWPQPSWPDWLTVWSLHYWADRH